MDRRARILVYASDGCVCQLKRHQGCWAGADLDFTIVSMPSGYAISASGNVLCLSEGWRL